MKKARNKFLKYTKRHKHGCCCGPQGGGAAITCVPPLIVPIADFVAAPGSFVSISPALSAGTGPLNWSATGLVGTGLSIDPFSGSITGTFIGASDANIVITALNSCGNDTEAVLITAEITVGVTIRWGNFLYADFPAAGPVFVATDFTGSNPNYVDTNASVAGTRAGTFNFAIRAGARQVFWIRDTLLTGSPTFTASGLPVSFDPGVNLPYQSLSIGGVPGKVYFTNSQNTGGLSVVVG